MQLYCLFNNNKERLTDPQHLWRDDTMPDSGRKLEFCGLPKGLSIVRQWRNDIRWLFDVSFVEEWWTKGYRRQEHGLPQWCGLPRSDHGSCTVVSKTDEMWKKVKEDPPASAPLWRRCCQVYRSKLQSYPSVSDGESDSQLFKENPVVFSSE